MSRVVLALGDETEAQALRDMLDAEGDEARLITSYSATLDILQQAPADQLLFDVRLCPRGKSLRRCLNEVQEAGVTVVLLGVTRDELEDLEEGLPFDDFLVMPIEPVEARVRLRQALWRRSNIKDGHIIKSGDLVIDLVGYQVHLAGKPVSLTFKEYELLRFLASNPGRVYTRDALLNRIWGYDYYGGGRTVDVHIRRLRSKIEESGQSFIETVRNVGYRFVGPEPPQ